MPNWCSNKVKVSGPKKSLEAFKATLSLPNANGEKTPFSFHQTVPMPANCFRGNLSLEDEVKHPLNWMSFGHSMWGCKWDCSDPRVEVKPKSVEAWFETPWSPPLEWLKNASAKFPELKFEIAYCEQGMAYYGIAEAINGEVSESTEKFPDGTTDDEGELKPGPVKKHITKYKIGMGG